MSIRKMLTPKMAITVFAVAILVFAGWILLNYPSPADRRPTPVREDKAGFGPDLSGYSHPANSTKATPTATPTPSPLALNAFAPATQSASDLRTDNPDLDPIPPGGHALGGDGEDIRSSPERMAAIERVEAYADDVFNSTGADEGWTVNQQDMDQQDYATDDGTEITKWYTSDGTNGSVQAEEAQKPNGEIVDRWYGANGKVNQVMHQYDERNSFSIYYYENGQPEATRVIKDGNEIFTKFGPDGRQIQKTYTPQVRGE